MDILKEDCIPVYVMPVFPMLGNKWEVIITIQMIMMKKMNV